jgi:hypothetical protein
MIFFNIFFVRFLINRALKKFVKPKSESKGFTFLYYKWCGLFSFGNFKDDKLGLTFGGDPRISIYVNIFYKGSDFEKHFTVRIDTIFGFIRKVAYSDTSFF